MEDNSEKKRETDQNKSLDFLLNPFRFMYVSLYNCMFVTINVRLNEINMFKPKENKTTGLLFFMRYPYMKFQDFSFNDLKVIVGSKKCDPCMHPRTSQKQYAPSTYSKLGA